LDHLLAILSGVTALFLGTVVTFTLMKNRAILLDPIGISILLNFLGFLFFAIYLL